MCSIFTYAAYMHVATYTYKAYTYSCPQVYTCTYTCACRYVSSNHMWAQLNTWDTMHCTYTPLIHSHTRDRGGIKREGDQHLSHSHHLHSSTHHTHFRCIKIPPPNILSLLHSNPLHPILSSFISEVHVHVGPQLLCMWREEEVRTTLPLAITHTCSFMFSSEVTISAKVREGGVGGGERGCVHVRTCFLICLSCTSSITG